MPKLSSLTVELRGDSTSLVTASRQGLRAIQGLASGVAGTVARVAGLGGAITGLVGGAGLVALSNASRDSVDRIGKLSTQLGVTGTEVQKLKLVAELSGVGVDELSKAMQRTARVFGDARAGSASAAEGFERLGLSLGELEGLAPLALFRQVVGRLAEVEDLTARASIGNDLFGRSWQQLGPLVEGFSDEPGPPRREKKTEPTSPPKPQQT